MRMTLKTIGAAALIGMASGTLPAMTATVTAQDDYGIHAGSIEVPVNKSQVITADRPISRAMIGNDEIADIFPISDRSVYVLGKATGTTSLTLYDRDNNVLAVMDVAVGPDVIGLREQVATLMPDEAIEATISNQSIVLSGTVSSAGAADTGQCSWRRHTQAIMSSTLCRWAAASRSCWKSGSPKCHAAWVEIWAYVRSSVRMTRHSAEQPARAQA